MTFAAFTCDKCKTEVEGTHDGYGGENAPEGWVQITTAPLHVSRVCGSRSGTKSKTLCPKCHDRDKNTELARAYGITRCIVPGCDNRHGEGTFEGPVCAPCAIGFRTEGKHTHDAASILLAKVARLTELEEKILALGVEAQAAAAKEEPDAAYRRHAVATNAPLAPEEPWAHGHGRHVSKWDALDALRWILGWAQVWHQRSGGYLASDTSNGLDACIRIAKPCRGCGTSREILGSYGEELHPCPHCGAKPERRTRRLTLWTGQKAHGIVPPPDWIGIRSALDHVLANEGLPGDVIRIAVEVEDATP